MTMSRLFITYDFLTYIYLHLLEVQHGLSVGRSVGRSIGWFACMFGRSVGRLVSLSLFPKRALSYTSMLLSEHSLINLLFSVGWPGEPGTAHSNRCYQHKLKYQHSKVEHTFWLSHSPCYISLHYTVHYPYYATNYETTGKRNMLHYWS